MTRRERFINLLDGNYSDARGLWLGNPTGEMLENLLKYNNCADRWELSARFGEEFVFMPADWYAGNGTPGFEIEGVPRLAEAEDISDLDAIDWPVPGLIDYAALDRLADTVLERASAGGSEPGMSGGMWSPFFHNAASLFGMEEYFVRMYTDPEIVHAVHRRIVDVYMEENARIFSRLNGRIDAFFMGNDFGTQLSMLISPEMWREFIKPYYRELICQAREYGLRTMIHSCGAVSPILPDLIELGVSALHPLQPLAAGMSAKELAKFSGKICFVGGIDTQRLLPNGTPDMVRTAVRETGRALGARWIVSPGHEGYEADTKAENIAALASEARNLQ